MPDQFGAAVESDALSRFSHAMEPGAAVPSAGARRLHIDPEQVRNGLAQLVLTLIKLLHELMERQALRRIDAGGLSEVEIERLGITLMRQGEQIDRMRDAFGLSEKDLNLDLGPLGKLL